MENEIQNDIATCPTPDTVLLREVKNETFDEVHVSNLCSRAKFYRAEIINTNITATVIRNYLYTSRHPASV
jgi:hypothetical protein